MDWYTKAFCSDARIERVEQLFRELQLKNSQDRGYSQKETSRKEVTTFYQISEYVMAAIRVISKDDPPVRYAHIFYPPVRLLDDKQGFLVADLKCGLDLIADLPEAEVAALPAPAAADSSS